ncbi:FIST N-terminal domain-containing protein [Sulfurimonas autotrophica]|uniref:Sensory/regulatory protein RpfC n=1 Tax=Sulfurimonas autotrophica (strain ATCC BAA-671 / DSM 16294 / JCM 11897 / OK10) TaxID=563040 RepID=E0UUJ9_SULAO|nr:FIST N-terminal domain-containing protein [Sulfurimonas autotrophica]ADN08435.1 multi-sensor hybrid histidine kinase [Sulfurimonas autotrophica DSM 16294]
MQQYNHNYTDLDDFGKFLKKSAIDVNQKNILIQMFTSHNSKKEIENIASQIISALPSATLIGASAAGEIVNGEMLDESTVVSISVFEKTKISAYYEREDDSYRLGLALSKRVFDKDTKCVITFLDGLEHNGQEYLHGLSSCNFNKVAIAGGMAADMLQFQQTYTVIGDKVFDGGAVCVSLKGDALEVLQDYNLGWRAVGPTFTITKADGARVYEINHRPIKDVYAEVLGEFAVDNMPASTIEFPLIRKEDDMLIARSMLNVFDDGSLLYGGTLEEGEEVYFGIGSRTLVNQYSLKEDMDNNSLQACFIYSCIARKQFLDKELEKIFRLLENAAPTSGFFTFGEFFHNDDKARLFNVTTTILFLREKGTQTVKHGVNEKRKIRNSSKTDSALFNLIEYVTTELKEQEKIFRASKFKLDEFLKALDSVVIISRTDMLGNITYVNERFEEVSGYTKEELIGKSHNIVRDPDVPDEVFTELWKEITKGNIWQGEFSNIAKDGSSYYVKSSIIPIHDENNEIIEYMAIREDVTSLVQSRKKAEEAEAAQAMFLANMSHEIRTPMNGILGFTELLSKTQLDTAQEKYVNVINSSTKTLLDIVNDILDSSKITNNKISLEKIPLNPFVEFATTYELLKSVAEEKALNYTLEIDNAISTCIYSDATRLRQVIINLLSNAIKFTPEYGDVRFCISLLQQKENRQIMHFSIEDSGIGIAKEKLQEIFKPFAQAETSTTRKFGGTGLGLSISADLLQVFGSELHVSSVKNEGSCFFFDLEFDTCNALQDVLVENNVDVVCQEQKDCDKLYLSVLVAEDYHVNRMLIESIFQKYKNITLEFACDGKEAVQKVQQNDYDVIFMDINMPVMNGLEAAEYIRKDLQADVAIVALTANAIKGDKERFIQSGMDDYLSKPIDTTMLEQILCKYAKKGETEKTIDIQKVLQQVNEKIGLNKEVGLKLLRLFLESLQEFVPVLEKAFKEQDNKKIYETAHKLKGAAGALYLEDIYELMQEVEKSALEKDAMRHTDKVQLLYEYMKAFEKGMT